MMHPHVVIGHLITLSAAVGWLWLMAAAGQWLVERLGVTPRSDSVKVSLSLGLGAGLAGTALLALGGIGALRPVPLLVVLGTAAVAFRRQIRGLGRSVLSIASDLREEVRARPESWIAVVGLAIVSVCALALAVAPVTDWDSLMYHVEVPALFLDEGRIHLPLDNLHVTRIGLVQLLYVVPLALGSPAGAAVLSLGFGAALALATYGAFADAFDRRTATVATTAVVGFAMLLLVAVTPRVDVALTLFLFLASVLIAREDVGEKTTLVTAGLLLGFAFATKFVAGPYVVALGAAVLVVAVGDRSAGAALGARLGAGLLLAATTTAVAAPWLLKNLLLVGAPFYPFLAEPVAQPWLRALGLAPDRSVLPPGTGDWVWGLRARFNLVDFVVAPERLTIEGEGRYYFASPMLAFLPLLVLRRRRLLLVLALPALGYIATIIGFFPQLNLRYLLPGLVPLAAVGAAVADQLFGGRRLVRAGLLLLALLPGAVAVGHFAMLSGALGHAVGLTTGPEYLHHHPKTAPLSRGAILAQRHVPPDGLVLMVYEARGFRFPRPAIQDNKATNFPYLLASGATERCLENTPFTHVLLNEGVLQYHLAAGLDPEAVGWDRFPDFADRCLRLVDAATGLALFEIRRSGPGSP